MNCEIFREMIGSYVDDSLEEDRRKWFRHHLRECALCREAALKVDATLLFAFASAAPPAPDIVEACTAAVASQIRQDRFKQRLHRRRRPWLAAAAAAVMIAAGGLTWRTLTGRDGGLQPTAEATREFEPGRLPPTVEVETKSEEVRVYRFATENDADTAIYFIVDPALEL